MRISVYDNREDDRLAAWTSSGGERNDFHPYPLHVSVGQLDNGTGVGDPEGYSIQSWTNATNVTGGEDASAIKQRALGAEIVTIVIIILLAVIGNVVMICAVLKTPYLRTVTNLFTINLAVSDLGIAVLIMPMWLISMALGQEATDSPIPKPLCEATAFVTVLLLLVSIATLSGISLDRYFSICHPLRYPREVTPNRVYCTIVYIWIQSILLSMSPLLGWGRYKFRPQTIPICNPEWSDDVSFSLFLVVVGLIIPSSAMLFSYIRIIQEARKQSKRIENIQLRLVTPTEFHADESLLHSNEHGSPNVSRRSSLLDWIKGRSSTQKQVRHYTTTFSRNLKTLKTVFIVVGAFFVCWGPYVLLNAWYINSSSKSIPYDADLATTLLALGNAAVNPFVFISLTRDFRYAVRMLLVRCIEYLCPEEASSGARRSSRHRDSMADTLRPTPRASFDSGVVVDREASTRRSSNASVSMHRVQSTITIRCDSIESDDDDAEKEPISPASTSQSQGSYGSTLLVPGAANSKSRSKPKGELGSAAPVKKPVFVSQFGPTLKPPDPFKFQFERPITPRLAPAPKIQEVEKQKIYTTSTNTYGSIGQESGDDRRKGASANNVSKQQAELQPKSIQYDRRIPILILPDDDSGQSLCLD